MHYSPKQRSDSQVLSIFPHGRSLRVAEQFAVSSYDARFLGAAQTFKARPVTEDARLRQAAPAPKDFAIDTLAASQRL
jgi:predicted nucleic acid-binding protein